MSREFKNYGLVPSPRPLTTGRYKVLSSTVAILGADRKKYYCYVAFTDKLVEKVGHKLPWGVSEHNPAFLYVDASNQQIDVWAKYLRSGIQMLMWSQSLEVDLPVWLKFFPVEKAQNGRTKKSSTC